MPTFESFKFPVVNWDFLEKTQTEKKWVNNVPDVFVQRLVLAPPDDLPRDYPNIDSHRVMFEQATQQAGGAVVSVDFITVKGIEAFQSIIKFRGIQSELGRLYLGTLMFPFENFFCGFSFQCDEYGTTGIRASMALEMAFREGKGEVDLKEFSIASNKDEFFDSAKKVPIVRLPYDDEKYDDLDSTHPLTRTRRYLKTLAETIEYDDEVRQAKPYRFVPKRGFISRLFNR